MTRDSCAFTERAVRRMSSMYGMFLVHVLQLYNINITRAARAYKYAHVRLNVCNTFVSARRSYARPSFVSCSPFSLVLIALLLYFSLN